MAWTELTDPERSPPDELVAQRERLRALPLLADLLDQLPDPALVLNARRQIVLANHRLAAMLGRVSDDLIGLRPGEALQCVRGQECQGGCGHSPFCRVCGATRAILDSRQQARTAVEECRISQRLDGRVTPLDLRVWAAPLVLGDDTFTLFTVRDISDEKRRGVLERLFFHDVLNAVGSLKSILDVWPALSPEEAIEFGALARDLIRQVADEIESQRDLLAAERGDLVVRLQETDAAALLAQVCQFYAHHSLAADKQVPPPQCEGPTRIRTDETLLRRVLGNLIKNALEASAPGQAVTVRFRNVERPTITVHNEAVMPADVQLQVFQRSFSTKAASGRGIGSYSVRLLTETYLGGRVHFVSEPGLGTVFTVELPPDPEPEPSGPLPDGR